MSRTTFSITFTCRESKTNKQGLAPLELSITINGDRKFINLPRKEKPSDFNRKRRSKDLEDYLSLMRTRINSIMTDMLANGEPITTERIREYVRLGGYKSYTVGNLFNDYLAILSKRVDVDLTFGVYRKYELVRNLFFRYVSPDAECSTITNTLIKQIQVDLYEHYDSSTAAGYLTKIKTFIKFGIDNGKIKINPLQGIKTIKVSKPIIYLTESEIKRIIDLRIDNGALADIRDTFILQISTGMAFCDLYALKREDIQVTDEGVYYISKRRQKTGTKFTAVILPMGVEVLKRHDFQLKVITNQAYNRMLKPIQVLSGIPKTLTTHVARRTYATLLLNKGVRLEVVSKALGHSKTTITQAAYAEVLNKTVINEVANIVL